MNTLYFIFFTLFLFMLIVVNKINIKKQQIASFFITILLFIFLYFIPEICIKIFGIFCNHYEPQISGYTFAIWYFIIYIIVSVFRFILSFIVTLYILYKMPAKFLMLEKYNLIILLSTLILDFIIYNFFVQKGVIYNLSQNNVILYSFLYSVTIMYLPLFVAYSLKSFVDFIKNKKS